MRGMETGKTIIRHKVFTEIARLAYEGGDYAKALEELPYKICPGDPDDAGAYKGTLMYERAVVGERLRLAMGLPTRKLGVHNNISDGVEESVIAKKYYEPPLINVIKFACNKCPDNVVTITDGCQACLEHPCMEFCPKKAISKKANGKAQIDQSRCIRCAKCVSECQFHAIIHQKRPCKTHCGVDAIGTDEQGRAHIDYSKCTSCGQCLANCPFGAIADKSQIFQVIMAINAGDEVIAEVAPAFVGQFGGKGNVDKLREAFKQLGFSGMEEVALGADLCTIQESEDFLEEVPEKIPFMGTSCCPAWSVMAKKEFPKNADCISMALTPMTLTARLIRKQHPNAKIVFVGPCSAKKLEAMRESVRSEVDFVLTFEEMAGMMSAKEIDYTKLAGEGGDFDVASADGRGFAVAGGVATAVANAIHKRYPEREVKVANAEGLEECRKLMKDAVKGKYDGYLLEGMACPGGCVAGAGTLTAVNKTAAAVKRYAKTSPRKNANENSYRMLIPALERDADGKHADEIDAVAETMDAQVPQE